MNIEIIKFPHQSMAIGSAAYEQVSIGPFIEVTVPFDGSSLEIVGIPRDQKTRVQRVSPNPVGGSALNTSRAHHQLGFNAHPVTAVGADAPGAYVRRTLEKANLPTDFVSVVRAPTAETTVLISEKTGAASLLVDGRKTASSLLNATAVENALNSRIAFDLISLGSVGHGFDGIAKALSEYKILARHQGRWVCVIWNPGVLQLLALQRRDSNAVCFLSTVDGVILNLQEARLVTESSSESSPQSILKALRRLESPSPMIITAPDLVYWISNREAFTMKSYYVRPISTYGAGDTFTATYGAAKALDVSEEIALALAMANAREVVLSLDATEGQKSWEWLWDFVERHPRQKQTLLIDSPLSI